MRRKRGWEVNGWRDKHTETERKTDNITDTGGRKMRGSEQKGQNVPKRKQGEEGEKRGREEGEET